jgi:hypothetical protein
MPYKSNATQQQHPQGSAAEIVPSKDAKMKRAGFPEVLQLQSFTDFSAASAGVMMD